MPQLAEKVNLSSCYVSQIERGLVKKSVSLPVLISIAEALDVEASKLFDFEEVKQKTGGIIKTNVGTPENIQNT